MLEIHYVHAFNDNYHWLLHDTKTDGVCVVDPGDATPVIEWLDAHHKTLTSIILTHRHWDHVNGVNDLVERYHVPVYGPASIDLVSDAVQDGDTVTPAGLNAEFHVIATPGHTKEHICYYDDERLFCGDTLFIGGCGRIFDGTIEQLHDSFAKLAKLPDTLQVYCAHEYTLANLRFALTIDPDNQNLQAFTEQMQARRDEGMPTVPGVLGTEKQINPYFTCFDQTHRQQMNLHPADQQSSLAAFACIRHTKDHF